jgi:hypothetical protein
VLSLGCQGTAHTSTNFNRKSDALKISTRAKKFFQPDFFFAPVFFPATVAQRKSLEQGDQMSLQENRPKCSTIPFCQNKYIFFFLEKVASKFGPDM